MSYLTYEELVQDALLGVVREALTRVEKRGLPGNHHFYVGFRTDHPGVKMADYLRERHPEEITIVLQYQFWDLKITELGFSITLSFNDIPENLYVPYAALTSFVDPSVRFGLQFNPRFEDAPPTGGKPDKLSENDDTAAAKETPGDNVVMLDKFRKRD